jgi:hypothetical protein
VGPQLTRARDALAPSLRDWGLPASRAPAARRLGPVSAASDASGDASPTKGALGAGSCAGRANKAVDASARSPGPPPTAPPSSPNKASACDIQRESAVEGAARATLAAVASVRARGGSKPSALPSEGRASGRSQSADRHSAPADRAPIAERELIHRVSRIVVPTKNTSTALAPKIQPGRVRM